MSSWKECLIKSSSSIMEAAEAIAKGGMQIAIVVDDCGKLLGILTDVDVRRAVIEKIDFSFDVQTVMKRNPIVAYVDQSREDVFKLMKTNKVHRVPILDRTGCVYNVASYYDYVDAKKYDNTVVLMAGGLGMRLRPLTEKTPKPMLKVGMKPILETILDGFVEKGFSRFFIAVNYGADIIEKYFGDGSQKGIDIEYIRETKEMGTAGALSLLPDVPELPIIVMNGDILTKVDYTALIKYHIEEGADATIAVREYKTDVPYGVIELRGNSIVGIREKPQNEYLVNAGIYVLNPSVLQYLNKGEYLDMPRLFEMLFLQHNSVKAFPVNEYWLDIGRFDDLERAQIDYDMMW